MRSKSRETIMKDTEALYTKDQDLQKSIENSIKNQYIVYQGQEIELPTTTPTALTTPYDGTTNIIVTGNKTYQAAANYKGQKVCVLDFASNHNIGGRPYSSDTQEETLCQTSTLLPCLEAMKEPFYDRHIEQFRRREINDLGTDDLIYVPGVTVIKSDVDFHTLPTNERFNVDVIVSAAPKISKYDNSTHGSLIENRLYKVLRVAYKEGADVLILGAWGCGYYHNNPRWVAMQFQNLLSLYHFKTVEFAMAFEHGNNYEIFKEVLLGKNQQPTMQRYFQIPIPINTDAEWYQKLANYIRKDFPHQQLQKHLHITVAFMGSVPTNMGKVVYAKIESIAASQPVIDLNIDTLNAFKAHNTGNIVINATSSQENKAFNTLKDKIRTELESLGLKLEDYRLHITLCQTPSADLAAIQAALREIPMPSFNVPLTTLKYSVPGRDGYDIKTWDFQPNKN